MLLFDVHCMVSSAIIIVDISLGACFWQELCQVVVDLMQLHQLFSQRTRQGERAVDNLQTYLALVVRLRYSKHLLLLAVQIIFEDSLS